MFCKCIYYDSLTHAIVYDPEDNNVSRIKNFAGESLIIVQLIDTQQIEYAYEMKFSLTVPLSFAEELIPINIITEINSSVQLPDIVTI